MMEPVEGAPFQPAIESFSLDASEPDQVTLTSEKEVPFAFRASLLNFSATDPSKVTFEPATTTRAMASPWELAGRPLTAAISGRDDGHEVTVLYATCRAVEALPPATAELISRFIVTANGLITAATILIILIVL